MNPRLSPQSLPQDIDLRSRFSALSPPWPRNKSAEVNVSHKDILVVLGELSSFLSLLRMASSLTQAVSHSEQRSTATVKYVSRFIASCLQIFIGRLSASIENISRVVVVSAFYETKRTASIFRQERSTSQPIIP